MEWNNSICEYCGIGYIEQVDPPTFEIDNIQLNQLYNIGQMYCNTPEYFLYLDDNRNVNIVDIDISKHNEIHRLESNDIPLDVAITHAKL